MGPGRFPVYLTRRSACALRLGEIVRIDHVRFLKLKPQIVSFTSPLAHAGEHRNASVLSGQIADQLLNDDRFADTRAAEQSDLATA